MLSINRALIWVCSLFTLENRECIFLWVLERFVWPENIVGSRRPEALLRSLTFKGNKMGANIDP